MTSVRDLWAAHKAANLPDPKAKTLANHRKYDRTEKGKRTRKLVKQRRKARESALIADFTEQDWQNVLEYFGHKCAYCGESKSLHKDHFVPVNLEGHTTRDNVVPSCRNCNTAKRDLHPFEWLVCQEHGLVTYARITQYLSPLSPTLCLSPGG